MSTFFRRSLPFVLLSLLAAAPAQSARRQAPALSDVCRQYETKILGSLESGRIRDAISAVSQYDEAVRKRYPAPTFASGLVRSEADHMSFSCPFDGWTRLADKDLGAPDWLPALGVDITLTLTNKSDRFVVMSLDLASILRGMATPEETVTDQNLNLMATMLTQSLGTEKKRSFLDIGDRKALVVDSTAQSGDPVELYLLWNGGRVYVFMTVCQDSEQAEIKAKLLSIVKSVGFHYKPAAADVASIRAKVKDPNDVRQELDCVRELALHGEFGDASAELGKLRLTIAGRIPKPVEAGGVMRYDSYGVSVTNPDADAWKSEVQVTGGPVMMMLESKTSVDPNGILIMVLDPLVAYGYHADQLLGDKASEAMKKSYLSSSGRGGLLNIGKGIESERFRTFGGMMAYEGIAATNMPNVKAKAIVALGQKYVLLLVLLVDSRDSERQFQSYENVLAKALILK